MSFFNNFGRGFGRSSRKKLQQQPQQQQQQQQPQQHQHLQQQQPNSTTAAFRRPTSNASSNSLRSSNSSNNLKQTLAPAPKPLFLSQPFVRTALVKGSFKTIVVLPKYVDMGEWLALNAFEFFTYLNLFYGLLSEFCTSQSCPSMSAGAGIDYTWLDMSKKPIRLPASTYIDYVLTWTNNKLNDQTVFPTKAGVPFPAHFPMTLRNIFKQMFRIFAHIYYNHFETIVHLSLEAHWNSFFAHFISFSKEFELLDRRDTEPLQELIESFEAQGKV
ncbi:Mob1/phocein [Lipomyces oligophaga]|uniref:Mob1/phocein n=1 Tax=Lipomyces oligophaga TaxID=45792 RepID=UPI0034CD0EDE